MLLHEGTKLFLVRIVNQKRKVPSKLAERQIIWRTNMDPKWNSIVDHIAVRIGMLVVGFGVWLAVSYGLLSA